MRWDRVFAENRRDRTSFERLGRKIWVDGGNAGVSYSYNSILVTVLCTKETSQRREALLKVTSFSFPAFYGLLFSVDLIY